MISIDMNEWKADELFWYPELTFGQIRLNEDRIHCLVNTSRIHEQVNPNWKYFFEQILNWESKVFDQKRIEFFLISESKPWLQIETAQESTQPYLSYNRKFVLN